MERSRGIVLGAALAGVVAALALAGCGGSSGSDTSVSLLDDSAQNDGKALSFQATTPETLRGAGGLYAIELRGILTDGYKSFDDPDYRDPAKCTLPPCAWHIVPTRRGSTSSGRS